MTHDDPQRTRRADGADPGAAPVVHHCPWCGEEIGSFWGRRMDDGAHWCESCQRTFRVIVVD